METIIIIVFVAGYLAITLEHSLKIDKLVPALVMMAICWAFISFGVDDFKSWFDSSSHKLLNNFFDFSHEEKMVLLEETLLHHLGKTAEILGNAFAEDLGFTNVYVLDGGIQSWIKSNKPLVSYN